MKHQFFIFGLLVILVACKKEDDILNDGYIEYQSENSISPEIDFYPIELYKNNDRADTPDLKIHFITSEIFPCANFHLASSQFIRKNELIVRFDSVQKYNICLTAFGPATSYVDLPENINKLILLNGSTVDEYQIDITKEKVFITPIVENFTNLEYSNTFRYPESTFAYICGTNLDNTHIYNDFLNILLDSTSVAEYKFNGEGRIPYPERSSGHWSDNPSLYFSYENQSDFDKAGELLRKFTLENISPNDGVTITLTSWDNRTYQSWLFYQ